MDLSTGPGLGVGAGVWVRTKHLEQAREEQAGGYLWRRGEEEGGISAEHFSPLPSSGSGTAGWGSPQKQAG